MKSLANSAKILLDVISGYIKASQFNLINKIAMNQRGVMAQMARQKRLRTKNSWVQCPVKARKVQSYLIFFGWLLWNLLHMSLCICPITVITWDNK